MKRRYQILLVITLVIILLDQYTKFLVIKHLTNGLGREPAGISESIQRFYTTLHPQAVRRYVVLENFWQFRYAENAGAAWGFLNQADPTFRRPFFLVVSLLAIAFILYFYRRLEAGQVLLQLALSLVMGGALGNFIDRLVRIYVIDFIDWH